MDLNEVQSAIEAAKRANGSVSKTASQNTPANTETFDKQAALKKEAETYIARGRLQAQGFIAEVLDVVDNMYKQALSSQTNMRDSGGVQQGGSKITEPGSLTSDGGNALPTSKDNPSKKKIDETKSVKHLLEDSGAPHGQVAVHKSEARINNVSK